MEEPGGGGRGVGGWVHGKYKEMEGIVYLLSRALRYRRCMRYSPVLDDDTSPFNTLYDTIETRPAVADGLPGPTCPARSVGLRSRARAVGSVARTALTIDGQLVGSVGTSVVPSVQCRTANIDIPLTTSTSAEIRVGHRIMCRVFNSHTQWGKTNRRPWRGGHNSRRAFVVTSDDQ